MKRSGWTSRAAPPSRVRGEYKEDQIPSWLTVYAFFSLRKTSRKKMRLSFFPFSFQRVSASFAAFPRVSPSFRAFPRLSPFFLLRKKAFFLNPKSQCFTKPWTCGRQQAEEGASGEPQAAHNDSRPAILVAAHETTMTLMEESCRSLSMPTWTLETKCFTLCTWTRAVLLISARDMSACMP